MTNPDEKKGEESTHKSGSESPPDHTEDNAKVTPQHIREIIEKHKREATKIYNRDDGSYDFDRNK